MPWCCFILPVPLLVELEHFSFLSEALWKYSLENFVNLKSAWKFFSDHVVSVLFKWCVSGVRSSPSCCHLNSVTVSKLYSQVCSRVRHLAEHTKKRNSSRSAYWYLMCVQEEYTYKQKTLEIHLKWYQFVLLEESQLWQKNQHPVSQISLQWG